METTLRTPDTGMALNFLNLRLVTPNAVSRDPAVVGPDDGGRQDAC